MKTFEEVEREIIEKELWEQNEFIAKKQLEKEPSKYTKPIINRVQSNPEVTGQIGSMIEKRED